MDDLYITLDTTLFVLNVLCAFLFNYVFLNYEKHDFVTTITATTNLFVLFPTIAAHGIWLKSCLLFVASVSLLNNLGAETSIDEQALFTSLFLTYSLSWWPEEWSSRLTKTKGCGFFTGNDTKYEPCTCKISLKLVINIIITVIASILLQSYNNETFFKIDTFDVTYAYFLLLFSVILASGFALTFTYNNTFGVFFTIGVCATFLGQLLNALNKDKYEKLAYAQWHVFIYTSAYCFSRAYVSVEGFRKARQF